MHKEQKWLQGGANKKILKSALSKKKKKNESLRSKTNYNSWQLLLVVFNHSQMQLSKSNAAK